MPANFLEKEANDRLIAAIIGSVDNNINVKEISRIYGDSVGFNTIEWYLRKIRHQAIAMKAEADGKPLSTSSPAKSRTKKTNNISTTKDAVKSGRVAKKKVRSAKVKDEVIDDMAEALAFEDHDTAEHDNVEMDFEV